MAGHPIEKRWAFRSLAILFSFLVWASPSVAGQGTRTSAQSLNHVVETQYAGSAAEEMRQEPGSVRTELATVPVAPLPGARGDAGGGEPKDLTAFFAIGFIINILLICAFIYWAVGQWRKAK